MAEHLSAVTVAGKHCLACAAMTLLAVGPALAQALPDPTRPPGSLSAAHDNEPSTGVEAGPRLQSIIISPARRLAIISGQTVKQGDMIGAAKVIRITETEVVLRNGKDWQTLKLFPNIEKQSSPERGGADVDSRGKKGKS